MNKTHIPFSALLRILFSLAVSLPALGQVNHNPPEVEPDSGVSLSLSASPPQHLSGSKYRKVALNGFPLPDEKPQSEKESDQTDEETYFDPLTGQLTHSTTDIYIPVPGSDLALTVRRNVSPAVYRDMGRSLITFENDPTLSFGLGWGSNLTANIKVSVKTTLSESSYFFERYVHVTDENGASHRFVMYVGDDEEWDPLSDWMEETLGIPETLGNVYYPLPGSQHDLNTMQSTLEEVGVGKLLFKKKYGTKLTYEQSPTPIAFEDHYFGYNAEGDATSVTRQSAEYYRLTLVEDRYGNRLEYFYQGGNNTLIPDEIRINGSTTRRILILREGDPTSPRVAAVVDPKGNVIDYNYTSTEVDGVTLDDGLLESVERPSVAGGRPKTEYMYDLAEEADLTPEVIRSYDENAARPPVPAFHCNIKSIKDAKGNTYQFAYEFDHSNHAYSYVENEFDGYYTVIAQPRVLTSILLPGGAGAVGIDRDALVEYNPGFLEEPDPVTGELYQIEGAVGEVATTVTDAQGYERRYAFVGSSLLPMAQLNIDLSPAASFQAPPVFIAFDEMKLSHPQDASGTRKDESVVYDVTLGLSPLTVTDFSGHTTEFQYGDLVSQPFYAPDGFEFLTGNPEPTSQTNAMGDTKTYEYDETNFYIMTKSTDELGRVVETPVDGLGRRLRKIVRNEAYAVIEETEFEYHSAFQGVVTKETVLATDGLDWQSPRITEYELYQVNGENGPAGHVKKEIVDMGASPDLVTEYTYDLNGNKTSVTDPEGYTTYFVYDGLNRLIRTVYPPATDDDDTTAPTRHIVYDLRSNKVGEIDENGHATVWKYDAFNRMVKQIRVMGAHTLSPDTPADFVSYSPAGADLVTSRSYNALGAKISETDPNGHTTHYYYDGLTRLVGQKEPSVDVFDPVTGQTGTMSPITWFYYGENCGGSVFNVDGFKPTHSIDARGYLTIVEYDELYRPVNTGKQFTGPVSFSSDPTTFPIPIASLPTLPSTPNPGDDYAQTVNEYDAVGNLLRATDDLGRVTETIYDALDRPIKIIHPDNTEVEKAYTSTGLEYKAVDELDRVTITEYDPAGRPVKHILPALAGESVSATTTTWYDKNGNVVQTENPLGELWNYEFDERNRQVKEIQPEVDYVEHVYDAGTGAWTLQSGTTRPKILTTYDEVGNPTSTTDPRENTTYTLYDAANRVTTTISPRTEVYDPATQTVSTLHPVNLTVYDKNGNIRKQQTGSISQAVTTVQEALTASIAITRTHIDNTWDAFNRLTSTTDAANITVHNEYDAANNRTAVVDGEGQRTEFEYDGLGRNTVTRHADDSEKVLEYNALVQTRRTDEMGVLTLYQYDSRNRLENVDYQNTAGPDRTYTYDLVGNILTVDEPDSLRGDLRDVEYVYDALDRIVEETSNGRTHEYSYDLAGNRLENLYAEGEGGEQIRLVSTYDALNRTATLFEDANANGVHDPGERLSGYQYDLAGNIRVKSQPNGHEVEKRFDALNRTRVIIGPEGADSQPLYEYAHEFDLYGNLSVVEESYPSSDAHLTARTIRNTYDPANRLAEETVTTGSDSVVTAYAYDAAHNRVGKTVIETIGGTPTTLEDADYTYSNDLNQIDLYTDTVSGKTVSYAYDLNGNRVQSDADLDGDSVTDETTVYTYDAENRLLTHEKTAGSTTDLYEYAYDYRTRRVLRDETGAGGDATLVVFSGGLSLQEWTDDNDDASVDPAQDTLEVQYVRGSDYGGGIGGILYTLKDLDSGGILNDASFNHYNSRGDVVAKAVDDGSLIYQAAYEAFGRHGDAPGSQEWGTNPDRQQANTKDEDPTGLLNEGFRYRDLETGTFITRDPLGFVDGPNVYTYVVQNPWTYYDPMGLQMPVIPFSRMSGPHVYHDMPPTKNVNGVEFSYVIMCHGRYGQTRLGNSNEFFLNASTGMTADQTKDSVDALKHTADTVTTAVVYAYLMQMVADENQGSDESESPGEDSQRNIQKKNDAEPDTGGESDTQKRGKRRKNRLPDEGEPNTTEWNEPGTTGKKYGPDGKPQKEFNRGHQGEKTPDVEKSDHIHDYKPNPHHPDNKPDRQPGRSPRNKDYYEFDNPERNP